MDKNIYSKLARANLKRNKQFYMPYFIASAIMCAMFTCIGNMVISDSLANVREGGTLKTLLMVGLIIMALFTFGYMLYLNSFLMKRRKKEFGLYAVLGLEKKHVTGIIMREMFMLNFAALLVGMVLATVFGKLIFMFLMSAMKVAEGSVFKLSLRAYSWSAVYFFIIYLIGAVYNTMQVRLADPIDLINGDKKGEKKMKGIVPITLLGAVCLGLAYYNAITVESSSLAMIMFWPCVALVIVGTYSLFAAGCQFVLKRLKSNEKFYYKPHNFISVSDLMYRMKQNSSGLANICILSTMVLVTISTCCSLYFGQEKILATQNPHDLQYTLIYDKSYEAPERSLIEQTVRSDAERYGVDIETFYSFYSIRDSVKLVDGVFEYKDENGQFSYSDATEYNTMHSLYIITQSDFNEIAGKDISLAAGEMAILTEKYIADTQTLPTPGGNYTIKGVFNDTILTRGAKKDVYFIAADEASATALRNDINPGISVDPYYSENGAMYVTVLDFTAENGEDRLMFASSVCKDIYSAVKNSDSGIPYYYEYSSIDINRADGYSVYGGFLFLGIFFTILFLINTIVIMYFKQVSEGYEDKDRFIIMQKVGLSDSEVKKIINRQTMILFFLPLTVALVHILAACNMLVKMLEAFVMTDTSFALLWIVISAVAFTLIYVVVYRITAKAYYRIVKW